MLKKRENIDEVAILEEIFDKIEQPGHELNKYDYICWVEKYTENKQLFTSEDECYESDFDAEKNLSKLMWFYDFIKEYADENFIAPTKYRFGSYYSIKFNNVGYNIGKEFGPFGRDIYFCGRTKIFNSFIDYFDIENNIPQKNTEHIKKQLKDLSDLITKMTNENVPTDAISEITEKTLKKVLSNKE